MAPPKMNLNTMVKEAGAFLGAREDENSWSKINDVLGRLGDAVKTAEDADVVLVAIEELLARSVQSDRSRLAGTALALLKSCILLLGPGFGRASVFLAPLIRICGKSNKVFYARGEDVFVALCRNANIRPHIRLFNEYCASANKNVRLALFRGIEAAFCEGGSLGDFEAILRRGRGDPFLEVRETCKRVDAALGIEEGESVGVSRPRRERFNAIEAAAEPARVIRQPVRANFIPSKSIIQQAILGKKELVSRFSPLRKQTKTNEDCDKIKELEKQIKDITENIQQGVVEERRTPRHEPIRLRKPLPQRANGKVVFPEESFGAKRPVDSCDLTPVRLDRYLSSYRKVYGESLLKKSAEEPVSVAERMDVEETGCDEIGGVCLEESELSLVDVEPVDDAVVGEISKNLANFSITEPADESENDMHFAAESTSVNPYEDVENRDVENEYTIVHSGDAEEGVPESGTRVSDNGSIHESTIVVDSPLRSGLLRKKELCGMAGNRFSGLLFLSESSGEETVFSNSSGRRPGIYEDVNRTFADKVARLSEGRGIAKENIEQFPESAGQDVVRNRVSSSFLHDMSLGELKQRASVRSEESQGAVADEEDDFTVVDSFIQVKRHAFRRNRMRK